MRRSHSFINGDYVYGPKEIQGVWFNGGVVVDVEEEDSADELGEWQNAELRESVARSGIVRCRKISSTNYFSKGKLNELGLFIKEKEEINAVYINTSLTPAQVKKLEKRWNDMIMDREDRVR